MNYPQELQAFWEDYGAWCMSTRDQEGASFSTAVAEKFEDHLNRLGPVAEGGNDFARYAMALVYLLELNYPDELARDQRCHRDREKMTELLCQCAENGMVAAFDNLVTVGIGEVADTARAAAREHESVRKPDWDEECGLPVYSTVWMESAMNLWRAQRGSPGGGVGMTPRSELA